MKRMVAVTLVIEIEVDETKFTEEWLAEFRQIFYPFQTVNRHMEHIAQLKARGLLDEKFTEGYGPLSEMGIKAEIIDQTEDMLN